MPGLPYALQGLLFGRDGCVLSVYQEDGNIGTLGSLQAEGGLQSVLVRTLGRHETLSVRGLGRRLQILLEPVLFEGYLAGSYEELGTLAVCISVGDLLYFRSKVIEAVVSLQPG